MRNYCLFLKDILEACRHIEAFVQGMTLADFCEDEKTKSAVIRKLEIIGEAAKQIPASIKRQNPQVPWKVMTGMRNRLIHGYFGIELKIVWGTVQKDIPPLADEISKILEGESD